MNAPHSPPVTGADAAAVSPRNSGSSAEGFDLSSLRIIRAALKWPGFPSAIQTTLLMVFAGLALLAWGTLAPGGVNPKLFAKSNLATLVIWGLWWPTMIWVAVLFGRPWCTVCPLELLSNLTEQLGRKAGMVSRPLPRWIAGGSLIVALYVTLQFLVAGVQLHRVPAYTSIFLLALLGVTVATNLAFQRRAFCRGFCPVGLLLGTYGRGGMLAIRPAAPSQPISGRPDARVCPSLLNPSALNTNKDCLVCCRCIRTASPGTMRLTLRPPFSAGDFRAPLAVWPVTLFVMVASGFVTGELCSEWPAAQKVFQAGPETVAAMLHAPWASHWIEGVWTLMVFPALLWTVLAMTLRRLGQPGKVGQLWRTLAGPMAVIIAAGHMSKALAKFVSWLPFLDDAVHNPDGSATALAITRKTMVAVPPLVALSTVGMVGLALVGTAFWFALREHRLARREETKTLAPMLPYGIVAGLFLTIIAGWTAQ